MLGYNVNEESQDRKINDNPAIRFYVEINEDKKLHKLDKELLDRNFKNPL